MQTITPKYSPSQEVIFTITEINTAGSTHWSCVGKIKDIILKKTGEIMYTIDHTTILPCLWDVDQQIPASKIAFLSKECQQQMDKLNQNILLIL